MRDAVPEKIAGTVDQGTFDAARLRGMLEIVYGDSPYAALVELYPDLQQCQMRGGASVAYSRGMAGRESALAATRWMLVQPGLSDAGPTTISARVREANFHEMHLAGVLEQAYPNRADAALADIDPWARLGLAGSADPGRARLHRGEESALSVG